MYLKGYKDAVAMRVITNDGLDMGGDEAAAAAWALYLVSNDQEAAKSSIRLSCESLLLWRLWQEYYDAWIKTPDPLIKQGRQRGYIFPLKSVEKREAYKIMQGIGRDPWTILAPESKIRNTQDCSAF